MITLSNTGGVAMTNCFLIADERAGEAVLFDAPDHTVAPLLDEISKRGWALTGLWLTHGHFDHFADHAVVKKRFPGAKVLIHAWMNPRCGIRMLKRACSSSRSSSRRLKPMQT
jgi:glyoxylase-like metal-dependent hydrolase (beta-lactamase superfamily II)